MKIKKYYSKSVVSIIHKGGSIRFLATSKGHSYLITGDIKIQKIIENSPLFKSGRIEIAYRAESEDKDKPKPTDVVNKPSVTEYGDVTKCVDAIAVLRGYGIDETLNSKAKILEAASRVSVSFPNL